MTDFSAYPNFSEEEFACKCGCGRAPMKPSFMARLQILRDTLNVPLVATSGFRCEAYDKAVGGSGHGAHTRGVAADIACHGGLAYEIVGVAKRLGFTGIGLRQHGKHSERFCHLDDITDDEDFPRPALWTRQKKD